MKKTEELETLTTKSSVNKKQLSSRLTKMIVSSTLCLLWSGPQEKGKTWWHSFTTKIHGFLTFIAHCMLMYFFASFLNLTLCMTKLRVLVLCLFYYTNNYIKWKKQRNLRYWLLSPVWTKTQKSNPLTKITVSTTLRLLWSVNKPSTEVSMMAVRPFELVMDITLRPNWCPLSAPA
jgi:hypothetical protein